MNKSQLIEALAKAENITLKKAEIVVNAVFENMAEALVKKERIEIRGFGSFKVKFYHGYQGRNPKTGRDIFPPRFLRDTKGRKRRWFRPWPRCTSKGCPPGK